MKPWIKMMLFLLAIGGFVKIFPLILNESKLYQEVIENSEHLGIDNSALFYSEEPHTSEAAQELHERLNFVVK